MEQILTFKLICPFWTSFRNPGTVNVHVTYPFPPLTTLYGFLNSARGMPQDWYLDRDEWQISVVIESRGKLVETFSKIMKVYEDKTTGEERKQRMSEGGSKGFFDRTTLIRQKLLGSCYIVYLKAKPDLLEDAKHALENPKWPLYLGESDDLVDVVSPHIVTESPKPVHHIHSVFPGIVEGCKLVNIPVRYYQIEKQEVKKKKQTEEKKEPWVADYRIYSLPPDKDGVEVGQVINAYTIEGRNIVFDENDSSKTKPNVIRSSQ
ncbi:TPA: CRISPR-associated protein Cas5 [bacterium]|nr:CRISPR-associated protein Cas5 [bacterium]